MREITRSRMASLDWGIVAAISLAIPVIAMTSLVDNRLPGTHDAYLHLQRLINAAVNLHDGVLMPRWGPQLHFGFGYPLGNFYAPGWHIAGGALVWAGLPAVSVWLLFEAFGLMLYPVGGYLFARLFTDRTSALLGAAVYLFLPIRFYEVFVQGNLSQLIAMGLIIWVLWALARCALAPSLGRIVVAAAFIAALMFTHHPTAAYAIPSAALYSVVAAILAPRVVARWKQIGAVGAAFVLGLLLSAAYWLPALVEVADVTLQSAASQYQLADYFIRRSDLLGPIVTPDHGALNIPFTLNFGPLVLGLTALGGLLACVPRIKAPHWVRFHAIAGAVITVAGLYAMMYPSLWLWEAIPKADLILFPWRLMGLVAAAMVPSVVFVLTAIPARWRAWGMGVLTAGLFAFVLPLMFPVYDNEPDLGPVTPATSVTFEMESGNLGGVANNEYLPRWVNERPDSAPCVACYANWDWLIFSSLGSIPAEASVEPAQSDTPQSSVFTITTPESFQFEVRQMYFPGWQATVDGRAAEIIITEPHGLMAVEVPAGTSVVMFRYAGTTLQHVADGLTLVGLAISVLLLGVHFRRRTIDRTPSVPSAPVDRRVAISVLIGMAAGAIVLRGVILPHTGWFRQTSALAAPAGMAHQAGITFTDAQGTPRVELIGYSLSQDEVGAGDWLFVDLYWRALTPLEDSWQAKLALADPLTQAEVATSDHVAPGGFSTETWPTDQFVVDTHILRLDSPLPYVYDLAVQLYGANNQHLQVSEGVERAVLTTVRLDDKGDRSLPEDIQRTDLVFGDWLRLRGVAWDRSVSSPQLHLYWEVLKAPHEEYALMLHFQQDAQTVANADQPPIPSYPTSFWRAGQYLESVISLDMSPQIDTLALGLYDRVTVQRVSLAGEAGDFDTANNSLLLSIAAQ